MSRAFIASPRKRFLAGAFFLGAASVTGTLAFWQFSRKDWKERLIEFRKERISQPRQPLDDVIVKMESDPHFHVAQQSASANFFSFVISLLHKKDPDSVEEGFATHPYDYTPVSLSGEFLYDKQFKVGLRGAPIEQPGSKVPIGAASTGSSSGYYLITPLKTSSGKIVFVNRGWVPRELASSSSFSETSQLNGILRPAEMKPQFLSDTKGAEHKKDEPWIWADLEGMSKCLGLNEERPLYVEATGASPSHGYPIRKPTDAFLRFAISPEMHLVYAGTWASLSLAITGLTFYFMRRRRPMRL